MGRVSAAHGGKETFFNKLGEKLPLNLNDVHAFQLAEEHGWQAQWLLPKKGPRGRRASTAAAPPAGQQTLTGMIASNASSTTPTTTTTASETPSDAAQSTPTRPSTAGASSPATVEVQSSPSPTALPFLFAPPAGTTVAARTTPRVVSSGAGAKAGGHVNQPAPPPARPVTVQSGPPPAPAALQGGPPPAPAAMPSGPPPAPAAMPSGPLAAASEAMPSGPPPAPMSGDGGNVAVESGTTRSKAGAMAPPQVPQCQICFNPLRDAPVDALPCAHTFHQHCIREWRQIHHLTPDSCPNMCHRSVHLVSEGDLVEPHPIQMGPGEDELDHDIEMEPDAEPDELDMDDSQIM